MAFVVGTVNLGARGQSGHAVCSRSNVRMMAETEKVKLPKDAPEAVEETPAPTAIKGFKTAPAWTIPEAIPTIEGPVPTPISPFVKSRRDAYVNFDIPKLIAEVNMLMFGPAFVPAFEKSNLSEGESYIRGGNMTIKEYIKFVAMSPAWRERFYENRPSMYSAVEVCYRKFYGTTPDTAADLRAKSDLYHSGGYEAFIESFFDEKYDMLWGDWKVPEWQNAATTDAAKTKANYTDLFDIVRGASASADVALTRKRSPASKMYTDFDLKTGCAPTRFGYSQTMVRIEIKGLSQRSNMGKAGTKGKGAVYSTRSAYSKFARTNNAIIVPFSQFSSKLTEIVKNGGTVVSVTTV